MKDVLVRLLKGWLPNSRELVTRLSRDAALGIAARHLDIEEQLPKMGATPIRERGRVVWRVVTNVGARGGHSQVYVDDETGEVVRTHTVEY